MNIIKNILAVSILSTIISCGASKDDKEKEKSMTKAKMQKREVFVDTIMLKKRTFNKQVTCNGKLRAIEKSNLNFSTSGIIMDIKAYNGNEVKKGDLLAVLDTDDARIELSKASSQMGKAYLDLIDKLIGQGYDADTTKVPAVVMKNVKITSGYNNSVEQLEAARRNLDDCSLRAPFSGRIANMDSKKHQAPEGGQFCTLINDSYFDVEFSLLEAEINEIAVNQNVIVSLFVDDSKKFNGKVTEINPIIDDKGQIKVRAKVKNRNGYLIEGMNVKIIIENEIKGKFVVPKDAVVSRDGYFVIFRHIDGVASWTYVDVVMSNVDSHVITGNSKKQTLISENDVIITSGNLNLADGTTVSVKAKAKR